jgi:acyl-CoA thioesterase
VVKVEEGYAEGMIEIEQKHLNPFGTVHGGLVFTLADTIGGLAAISRGGSCTTVSSDIIFLSPTLHSKKLIAKSTEIKRGKRMGTVTTVIADDRGENIATANTVYYFLGKDGKAV